MTTRASARVLADSISPSGFRLTTLMVVFARIVLAEFNTHRVFGRNFASTRAIPLAVQIHNLLTEPFIPQKFGMNQPGMQAFEHLEGVRHDLAVEIWLEGRDRAITTVLELVLGPEVAGDTFGYRPGREYIPGEVLLERFDDLKAALPKSSDNINPMDGALNVHKQLAGRLLEPWMFVEGIVTATEFDNFFALRDHEAAQGEIAELARAMREAINDSSPTFLLPHQWHLPLVDKGEFEDTGTAIRASAARCAAVSYKRQNLKNPEREMERYTQLLKGGHMSPFEHQATPFSEIEWHMRWRMAMAGRDSGKALGINNLYINQAADASNFCGPLQGWRSHRKEIETESNFALAGKE